MPKAVIDRVKIREECAIFSCFTACRGARYIHDRTFTLNVNVSCLQVPALAIASSSQLTRPFEAYFRLLLIRTHGRQWRQSQYWLWSSSASIFDKLPRALRASFDRLHSRPHGFPGCSGASHRWLRMLHTHLGKLIPESGCSSM